MSGFQRVGRGGWGVVRVTTSWAGFQFRVMTKFWNPIAAMVAQCCELLLATKVCALK